MDLSAELASPMRLLEELRSRSDDLPVAAKGIKKRGGWKIMPFIIGNESCANLATVSLYANLVVFLTTQFEMDQIAAAKLTSVWGGANNLVPVAGAFIADSYLGRFWAIVLASIAYVLALSLMTLISFLLPTLKASGIEFALLYVFLGLMLVGSSGVRSCSIPFGAEQFDTTDVKGRKKQQSFFNWYYFMATVSTMSGLTFLVYLQSKKWSLGFGMATILMVMSTAFFLLGTNYYVYVSRERSPFTGYVQVIVASIRKRNLVLPSDPKELYNISSDREPGLTDQFKFLNKAAIIMKEDDFKDNRSEPNPWRLCPLCRTEELKSVIAILPIWSGGIVVAITLLGTAYTYMIYQAQLMHKRIGPKFEIPPASYSVFGLLAIAMWLPLYDRLIVPFFRRLTKRSQGITLLERIGTGLVISILTMVVAGVVEVKRRESKTPISGFWLVPQYVLVGLAEAFYTIGMIEFLYVQFPRRMRSTAVALYWCGQGIGLLLSSVVITLVHNVSGGESKGAWLPKNINKGRLEYFYWFYACLCLLNFIYFLVCASSFRHLIRDRSEENPNNEGGFASLISV